MGKSSISMAIFNSYVSLPEGINPGLTLNIVGSPSPNGTLRRPGLCQEVSHLTAELFPTAVRLALGSSLEGGHNEVICIYICIYIHTHIYTQYICHVNDLYLNITWYIGNNSEVIRNGQCLQNGQFSLQTQGFWAMSLAGCQGWRRRWVAVWLTTNNMVLRIN